MSDKLVTIGSCENSAQAHTVCSALEAAGIRACVFDGFAADTFWHLSPAVGGAKIQVAQADEARARAILAELRGDNSSDAATTPWHCAKCDEDVDAGFDVCWSCGGLRADVEGAPRTGATASEAVPLHDFRDRTVVPEIPTPSAEQALNPYAPSHAGMVTEEFADAEEAEEDSPEAQEMEEVEAIVRRAFRAAVFGLVSCPGLLHIYSLLLVVPVLTTGFPLRAKIRRQAYFTLAADLTILSGVALAIVFGAF